MKSNWNEETLNLLRPLLLVVVVIGTFLVSSCQRASGRMAVDHFPAGDPDRGRQAVVTYGCTTCHIVPGVRSVNGLVGPPLTAWAERGYIAGRIPNTPENLVSWIMNPQAIDPGNAMPNMDVTWGDAQDMAAYLFTLTRGRFR